MKKYQCLVIGSLLVMTLIGCGKEEISGTIPEETKESVSLEKLDGLSIDEAVKKYQLENPSFYEAPTNAMNDPDVTVTIGHTEIKASELYYMTEEDFETFCKENYQTIAKDLDVPWEEIDWGNARDLLFDVMFGYGNPKWAEDPEIPDLTDPDIIYTKPPVGYLESLTDEELIEYLIEKTRYLYPDIVEDTVDQFRTLPEDQLKEIREMLEADEVIYKGYEYNKE